MKITWDNTLNQCIDINHNRKKNKFNNIKPKKVVHQNHHIKSKNKRQMGRRYL